MEEVEVLSREVLRGYRRGGVEEVEEVEEVEVLSREVLKF